MSLVPPAGAVADLPNSRSGLQTLTPPLDQLGASPERTYGYDAISILHYGHAREALERMAPEPRRVWKWITWIWLHRHVALRAEATMLAGSSDACDRLAEARTIVAGRPCDRGVGRSAAQERLLATADTFDVAGCRYQSARTLVLSGGDHAVRGAAALTDLGSPPCPTGGTIPLR
jgi:hypothetical protein